MGGATKHRLGKLNEVPQAMARFAELVTADGFTPLPIEHRRALRARSNPQEHRDPFDRMLAAQSEIEDLTLVTCDAALGGFRRQAPLVRSRLRLKPSARRRHSYHRDARERHRPLPGGGGHRLLEFQCACPPSSR